MYFISYIKKSKVKLITTANNIIVKGIKQEKKTIKKDTKTVMRRKTTAWIFHAKDLNIWIRKKKNQSESPLDAAQNNRKAKFDNT